MPSILTIHIFKAGNIKVFKVKFRYLAHFEAYRILNSLEIIISNSGKAFEKLNLLFKQKMVNYYSVERFRVIFIKTCY